MDEVDNIGWKSKLGSFIVQCKRVWHVLRKPTGEEFKTIAKVSAIGLVLIGLVGFIVAVIMQLIKVA